METNDQLTTEEVELALVKVHEGKEAPEIAAAINAARAQRGEKPVSEGRIMVLAKALFGALTSADWNVDPVRSNLDRYK